MQVLCKSSNDAAETYCSVCGRGFALFWERQTKAERATALQEIAKTLRSHHRQGSAPEVHPQHGFAVPDREGAREFSGAAILGHAPTWGL